MAGIGNPYSNNAFQGIKKYDGPRNANNKKTSEEKVGNELNDLAGVKRDSFFVDKDKHNQLGKDSFLKLLSNQLQHQDPFKPMDQKEFAADLAQFGQLEQLANLNTKMDKANQNVPNESKAMGAALLGKTVETKDSTIPFDGSAQRVDLPFYLPQAAKKVMVRIYDSANNLIQQIEKDDMGKGPQSIVWKGDSLDGHVAAKDNYRFEIRAWDNTFNQFKGETRAKGLVTGVHFEGDEMVLTVDKTKKVFLRDVSSFSTPDIKQNIGTATNMPSLKQAANSAYNKMNEASAQ